MNKFDRWVGYWAYDAKHHKTLADLDRGTQPELDCLVVRTEEDRVALKAYLLIQGYRFSVAVNEVPQGMSRAFVPIEDFPFHSENPRNG